MAQLNSTNITGNLSVSGTTITSKIIKNGGTSDDILLGDGSVASLSQYATKDVASTSANGLMSKDDKTKLNNIAPNANAYTLPPANSSTLGGIKISFASSTGTLTITT